MFIEIASCSIFFTLLKQPLRVITGGGGVIFENIAKKLHVKISVQAALKIRGRYDPEKDREY